MKILVISPQPFFSPRGTPFSVYYRTLITAELGAKIDLLTYGQGEDVDIDGVNIIRIPRFKSLGDVKVGPSLLKLFLDVILIFKTMGLLLRNDYDVVHAHEEAVFFCYVLKPLFGYKLIYDMHSSLPQQLENFKFSQSRLLIGIFKGLEDRCLKSADAVITICPALADYVLGLLQKKEKHFLIENSLFDPVRLSRHVSEAKAALIEPPVLVLPSGKKSLVYAGTLEAYQGIELMLKAFVESKLTDAVLVIVGGGPAQVEYYQNLARQMGVFESCLFTGQVGQALAHEYMKRADVLVSPRIEGTNTPLKVYQLLASGIPIVATNIYSHTQVLNQDVAFLVDPTPADMAKGMLDALTQNEKREQKIAHAHRLYEKAYSRDAYIGKMRALLECVR